MIGGHYLYFLQHNIRSRLLGQRQPLLTGFKLTHRCNLRCRVCPFWKKDTPDMSLEQVVGVLHRLHDAGVRLLILEGGEPFLWRDGQHTLHDVVAAAKPLFFCTGVVTNGTLPIETEADVVWVSVDGLGETNDYNRGPVFERVMANVERSSHPRLLASVTINRLNAPQIPDLVRYLAERVTGITLQFYYPYRGTEDLSLTRQERHRVLDQLIALKRAGYPLADSIACLEALKDNRWRCHSWLISSVEPDGAITFGCYVKNRGRINCAACGFAPHTEISLAYDWNLEAIATGRRVFGFR